MGAVQGLLKSPETDQLNLFILMNFAICLLLLLGFHRFNLKGSISSWLLSFFRALVVKIDEVKDELHGPQPTPKTIVDLINKKHGISFTLDCDIG